MLEENFQEIASYVALGIEAVVVIVLLYAAGVGAVALVAAVLRAWIG